MKKNQKGFSAIELLLVLIFITLVVFVGYYVYNNQNKANNSKATPTLTPVKSSPTTDASTKLTFPDLKVLVTLPTAISDLTYTTNTDTEGVKAYNVSTPAFDKLAVTCGSSAPAGFAYIFSSNGTFKANDQFQHLLLKQFPTRSIEYGDSLAYSSCDQAILAKLTTMQANLNTALSTAFKTATETN